MRWILALVALALVGGGAWWLLKEPGGSASPLDGSLERAGGPADQGPRLKGSEPGGTSSGARTGRCTVVGRVTRAGQPAAARVEVFRVAAVEVGDAQRRERARPLTAAFQVPEAPRATASGRADDQGRFEVGGLATGCFRVEARAADGAFAWATVALRVEGARLEVALSLVPQGLVLEGSVRYADGRPFPGTLVVLAEREQAWNRQLGRIADEGARTAKVGQDGAVRVEGLGAGPFQVRAVAQDGATAASFPVVLPASAPFAFVVPEGSERLTGRVLAAGSETPVAGATVVVTWYPIGITSVRRLLASDAEGRFEMQVGPGTATVEAEAPGYGRASVGLDPTTRTVLLRLVAQARVAGRVTTSDGSPCPGAIVLASTARPDEPERANATADAQGRYAFEAVAAGEVTLVVRGGGWVTPGLADIETEGFNPFQHLVPAGTNATIDLVAARGARLEGRVLDADGTPVAGATLQAAILGDMFELSGRFAPVLGEVAAVSGADGTFAFDALVAGTTYNLLAEAPGRWRVIAGPFAVADATTQAEVRFPPVRFVDVLVLTSDDGSPVEGAAVSLFAAGEPKPTRNWRWNAVETWTTDQEGRARLGPAGLGELHVSVAGDPVAGGGRSSLQVLTTAAPKGATVVPDSASGAGPFALTVRVPRGRTITGRALRADGSPAVGASVFAQPEGATNPRPIQVSAGPDGAFVVRGLVEGAHKVSASLRVEGAKYARGTTSAEAGSTGVTVTLAEPKDGPAPVVLLVRVVDPAGEPVPYAQVSVEHASSSSHTSAKNGLARIDRTFSEGSGPRSFAGARVRVWGAKGADGLPLPLGPGDTGVLGEGQTEITVQLAPGRSIEGRVLLEDGQGLAGVLVKARRSTGDLYNSNQVGEGVTHTDAQGAFRVLGLSEGPYTLEVQGSPDLVPPEAIEVRAGDQGVELRVRRGVAARIRVLDGSGAPVPGARVSAQVQDDAPPGPRFPTSRRPGRSRDETGQSGTTDGAGAVLLRGLDPAKTWVLHVSPPKGREDAQPWKQERWTPADTDVRLAQGFVVSGTVRDAQGRPVAQATVRYKVGESWTHIQPTGADGTFRIVNLARGPVTLQAAPQGWGGRPALPEVTVQAGTEDVVLTVDPGVELVVRVTNPEVRAQADRSNMLTAMLLARGPNGPEHAGWAHDSSGKARLVFPGLKADTLYTVWIRPDEGEWYGLASDVKAGGAEVALTLERGGTITGQVTAPQGSERVNVQATNEALLQSGVQVDAQGRYALNGLPRGTWTIRAYGRVGETSWQAEGKASVGGTLDLTLAERVR